MIRDEFPAPEGRVRQLEVEMKELLFASVLWALSFGLIKNYLGGLSPFWVGTIRLVLSFLLFLPWMRPKGIPPRRLWAWIGIGALQFGLMYLLYLSSFRFLKAHEVALLTLTTPVFVVLAGSVIERNWVPKTVFASVLAVVTSAGAVLNYTNFLDGFDQGALGVLLVTGANLFFSVGQILARQYRFEHFKEELNSMGWMYFGGASVATLAFLGTQWGQLTTQLTVMTTTQLLVVLHLGLVASGFGFYLWTRGVRRTSVGTAAVLNNVKVPLGVMASALIFNETVVWIKILPAMAVFWLLAKWVQPKAVVQDLGPLSKT